MRKVEYDYEPECWEMLDSNGKKIDLIADAELVSDEEFYAHLEKKYLTEEEVQKLL